MKGLVSSFDRDNGQVREKNGNSDLPAMGFSFL